MSTLDRLNKATAMPRPTADDIAAAIKAVQLDAWIDPCGREDHYWDCDLHSPEGQQVGNGTADEPGMAMALAWIAAWHPDALIAGCLPENSDMPGEVPDDGWRFVLTRPAVPVFSARSWAAEMLEEAGKNNGVVQVEWDDLNNLARLIRNLESKVQHAAA